MSSSRILLCLLLTRGVGCVTSQLLIPTELRKITPCDIHMEKCWVGVFYVCHVTPHSPDAIFPP